MLCTRQYSSHCAFTFLRPRRANRRRPRVPLMRSPAAAALAYGSHRRSRPLHSGQTRLTGVSNLRFRPPRKVYQNSDSVDTMFLAMRAMSCASAATSTSSWNSRERRPATCPGSSGTPGCCASDSRSRSGAERARLHRRPACRATRHRAVRGAWLADGVSDGGSLRSERYAWA